MEKITKIKASDFYIDSQVHLSIDGKVDVKKNLIIEVCISIWDFKKY